MFFSSIRKLLKQLSSIFPAIFLTAKTIKLIILPIIQNSEKNKFTEQSRNVIIDKLSGLFGKIYIKEKQIRKVITQWEKNPKKAHKIKKHRPGL